MADPELSPISTLADSWSTATIAASESDDRQDEYKTAFLAMCVHMDASEISEKLFHRTTNFKWSTLFRSRGQWDRAEFEAFLQTCEEEGLIQVYPYEDDSSFSIMPSARTWIESTVSDTEELSIAYDIFELLSAFLSVDDESEANWQRKEETVRHLDSCLPFLAQSSLYQLLHAESVLKFLELAAHRLSGSGYYEKAKALLEGVMADEPSYWETPQALQVQNELAVTYDLQGDFRTAQALLQSTVEKKRVVYGPEHSFTFQALDDLANACFNGGKATQAAQLLEELIDIKTNLYGISDPSTLLSKSNLAIVRAGQGRYHEAQLLYSFVVSERRKLLPPDHLELAMSLHNLGAIYADRGLSKEASEHFQRALTIRRQKLGPRHPQTLTTLGSLGVVLTSQDEFDDAEAYLQQALESSEKLLGSWHPITVKTREGMGILYGLKGMHEASEAYLQEAWSISAAERGFEHPDSLSLAHNLGLCLQKQGRFVDAEKVYEHALKRETILGVEHPLTKSTKADYQKMRATMERHTLVDLEAFY